jgi:hypothetical protein
MLYLAAIVLGHTTSVKLQIAALVVEDQENGKNERSLSTEK